MATTQRILLLVIFANLIITTVMSAMDTGNDYSAVLNQVRARRDMIEEQQVRLEGDPADTSSGLKNFFQKAWTRTTNVFSEVGDAISISIGWMGILITSILPFGHSLDNTFVNPMESWIFYLIQTFRMSLMALIALEIFITSEDS